MDERIVLRSAPGIIVQVLEPLPEGVGPYQYDSYHMGKGFGNNVHVMFGSGDKCDYLIICNLETRSRIRLEFTNGEDDISDETGMKAANMGSFIDMLIKNPHLYGG